MPTPLSTANVVCFGTFQLDRKARELHKAGVRVKLQDQPFRVLALLVDRAGQVVTREELQQQVWPTDVYVAFDQGLNNAIKKVRTALGDSAENPRFVETVARQGYRFIAPVTVLEQPMPPPSTAAPPPSKRRGTTAFLIAVLSVVLLTVAAYWLLSRSAREPQNTAQKTVLAVLPFDNLSRDPDEDFFSEGLTEEMISQLGKLNRDRLAVIARRSVAKYKGSNLSAGEIGKQLRADYLVQGSVRRAADRVRITVQLIQVRDQTDLWTESYDRELKDMLQLQDSVVRTIADQIHLTLTADQQTRLSTPRHVQPEAYEAYLKGRYYWNKRTADSMAKAAIYFEEAIDKDPTYSAAYSGLADCNSGLAWHGFKSPSEALPRAEAAARKSIELDPLSAEAHASLGLVLYHRWAWSEAENEFKYALQLGPQYANAHHWYGDYLSARGRHNEALIEAKQALELDPLNMMIGTWVALRYYLARNYDRSIAQSRSTVDLDPNFAAAHLVLGESYARTAANREAVTELETAAQLSGGSPLYLAQVGVADAVAGRKSEAMKIATDLEVMSKTHYVSPYGVAQIYAALGDREKTFHWLEVALKDRAVWMTYLAVDPAFEPFRNDPQFQDFLRQVGLL